VSIARKELAGIRVTRLAKAERMRLRIMRFPVNISNKQKYPSTVLAILALLY